MRGRNARADKARTAPTERGRLGLHFDPVSAGAVLVGVASMLLILRRLSRNTFYRASKGDNGRERGRQAGRHNRKTEREGGRARRKSNMVFEAKVEAKTNASEWVRTFNIGKRLLRR